MHPNITTKTVMTGKNMQTWHPVWEEIFLERSSWGNYPPEELVRFVAGHYYDSVPRMGVGFLDIGCGPGAGPSWYLAREGFCLCGIDGSPTAIARAKVRFEDAGLNGEFSVGDLAMLPWPDAYFDCVIDVACLQHNSEADAESIMQEVYRVLRPGGRHFSLTAMHGCWGDGSGPRVDATSFTDLTEGPFASMGVVRFATEAHLEQLYRRFRDLNLEHSVRTVRGCKFEIANWIVTCTK
jgi:SAM-dependent methyltransferase